MRVSPTAGNSIVTFLNATAEILPHAEFRFLFTYKPLTDFKIAHREHKLDFPRIKKRDSGANAGKTENPGNAVRDFVNLQTI